MTERETIKQWLMADFLNFVAFFFKKRNGTKFVVSNHHRIIADALMDVVMGDTKNLIINIAPRYSKTELVSVNFPAYCYALNPRCNFIQTSYSADLTEKNSMVIKDIMRDEDFLNYFEGTRIDPKNDTKANWHTTDNGTFYATSTLGQLTGFGAGTATEYVDGKFDFGGCILIDDPIKPVDALSATKRNAVNEWFDNTLRSRTNNPKTTPIIIVMQRLHEEDLCGFLTNKEAEQWRVISLPCLTQDDEGNEFALWSRKHDVNELHKLRDANPFVFETQYQQNPKPTEGLLYEGFEEYDVVPICSGTRRKCCVDTADTGKDYLCAIVYDENKYGCYVRDIMYTQKPMEWTETKLAEMITKWQVDLCNIESNNGGRGFARNVEANCRQIGNLRTRIKWYCQHENKEVRIFTHSADVQNMVKFPPKWTNTWSEFANTLLSYRKTGRNEHDDAPDCLTKVVELYKKSNTNFADYF